MDVLNSTGGACLAAPVKDRTGRDVLAVVLQYTFVVDARGRVELDPEGGPPRLVDEYWGKDPLTSSVRYPGQLFEHKPGTDVILLGHAHPRGAVSHVDVSLRVGPLHKALRAHGLRVFQKGSLGGLAPGPALRISEPVPLVYELAWGGSDYADPERPVAEPRNYVGRGVARDPRTLVGAPAHQLEGLESPTTPACFGALHRHWEPRMRFAGTYDEAWQEAKMPLLPDDFDDRYNIGPAPDQWSELPLRGTEPFELVGVTPEGTWAFQLPRVAPGFASLIQGLRSEHRTHLDGILIDADRRRVELVFRAAIPLPRKYEMLEHVLVFEKRLA